MTATATYRFNAREIATILHALRSMEHNLRDDIKDACNSSTGCDHFDEIKALDSVEIGTLCERLNPLDVAGICRECGAGNADNGEGWDGLCGNCADKAEDL